MIRTNKKILCLAFGIGLIVFGGCSTELKEVAIHEEQSDGLELIEMEQIGTIVQETAIEIPKGNAFGCMAISDECVYYEACEVDSSTGNYLCSTVYCMDISNKEIEMVFEINNEGSTFFTNEFVCGEDALYWVYRDADTMQIQQYAFDTGEISVLEIFPVDMPDLILEGDNRFLTWFTFDREMIRLFVYDSKTGETKCVSECITNDSPYTRAYVYDGVTSFVEARDSSRILVLYDLVENKRIAEYILPERFGLTRLQANAQNIVCTDGYGREASLYCLHANRYVLDKMDTFDYEVYLFSYRIYHDLVAINSNLTNEAVVISVSNEKLVEIPVNCRPVKTGISTGGVYYACDPGKNVIVFIDLEELSAYLKYEEF